MNAKTLVTMIAAIGMSLSFGQGAMAQSSAGSVDAQSYEWLKAPVASQPDPMPLGQALRQLAPPTLRVVYEDPTLAQAMVAWPQSPSRAGALNQATRNAGLVVAINSDGTLSVRKGPNYRPPVAQSAPVVAAQLPAAAPSAVPVAGALPPGVSAMFGAGAVAANAPAPASAPMQKPDSAVAQVLPQVTPATAPNRIDPADIAKARAYVANGGVAPQDSSVAASKDRADESIAPNAPLNDRAVRYLSGFIDNPNRIVQLSVREGSSYRSAFSALLTPKTVQWRAGNVVAGKHFQITGPAKQVLPRLLRQVKRDTGLDLSLEIGRRNVVVVAVDGGAKVVKEASQVPRAVVSRPTPKTDLPPPGAGQSDNDMAIAAVVSTNPTLLLNKGQSIGNAWLTAGIRQNVKVYWDAPDYIVTDNVRLEGVSVEELGRQLVNSLNRNGANLKLVVYENPQGGVSSYRIVTAN